MITHDLIQGSPQWLEYRAKHFNASDAPAMLGCSAYKSRSQLIAELATGLTTEIDSFTRKRFSDGHLYEALARPIAESIIGEDLYPVVGSEGKYSASFDGLTLAENIGFEHKTLNDELRGIMAGSCSGADLPKMYRVQMEQQCMVSGAGRILFMASKWQGEELVEEFHCWYEPDAALRAEIIAGWEQLEADVAAYVPAEPVQKLVAASFETLPAISVQIKGEVTASNMDAFKDRLAAYIASVKTDLVTDQDFVDADAAAKNCATIEKRLAATKEQVLGQVADIDAVVRALDDADKQVSQLRIMLEKEIKAKKELLKAGILTKAQQALKDHAAALEKEIAPLTLVYQSRDFAGAMKGLRTIATLQNAADTELAAGKIMLDQLAAAIRARQAWFKEVAAQYLALFPDLQTIIQKADDDFKLVVNTRIDKQKADDEAKLEAERQRIAAAAAAPAPTTAAEAVAQAKELTKADPQPMTLNLGRTKIELIASGPGITNAEVPTLTLGEMSRRFGFVINGELLAVLGFPHHKTNAPGKLYHEADFKRICQAITNHVAEVATKF